MQNAKKNPSVRFFSSAAFRRQTKCSGTENPSLITDFTELVRMNVGIYENQIFSKGPLGGFYTGKQLHMTLKDLNGASGDHHGHS